MSDSFEEFTLPRFDTAPGDMETLPTNYHLLTDDDVGLTRHNLSGSRNRRSGQMVFDLGDSSYRRSVGYAQIAYRAKQELKTLPERVRRFVLRISDSEQEWVEVEVSNPPSDAAFEIPPQYYQAAEGILISSKSKERQSPHKSSQAEESDDIDSAIEQSRWMLDLEENWDDDGAPAVRDSVWRRATNLLREIATKFEKDYRRVIPLPSIMPTGDGGIDLHWRNSRFDILLNVPPEAEELATFYGENAKNPELGFEGSVVLGEAVPQPLFDLLSSD